MQNPQPCDYKILTWNCRQLTNKTDELIKHSSSYNIIICTEIWLKPSKNFSIPGFHAIKKDREHSKVGGILIAVKKTDSIEHPSKYNAWRSTHRNTRNPNPGQKWHTNNSSSLQNAKLTTWSKHMKKILDRTKQHRKLHSHRRLQRSPQILELLSDRHSWGTSAPRNRRNRLHDLKHKHCLLPWI